MLVHYMPQATQTQIYEIKKQGIDIITDEAKLKEVIGG